MRSGWRGRLATAAKDRRTRRGAVLLSIVAFLAVLLGSTVAAYVGQQGDIAALEDKVAGQEQDVEALQAEQERWSDPAYVEQQARERLHFVMPGERSLHRARREARHRHRGPRARGGLARRAAPWYETVWQSSPAAADVPGARR